MSSSLRDSETMCTRCCEFLDAINETSITNEAEVETRLVLPLLYCLGYDNDDIRPKYPVVFREGTKGRNPEADFVVFAGPEHSKNTSLLVVEAKHPNDPLGEGKGQGESYAANLRAPFLVVTNGRDFELWQLQVSYESECVFSSPVTDLARRIEELNRLIWKNAAVKYKSSLCQKNIIEFVNDFRSYFDSELLRTVAYEQVVGRRLNPAASESADVISSDLLLDELPIRAMEEIGEHSLTILSRAHRRSSPSSSIRSKAQSTAAWSRSR